MKKIFFTHLLLISTALCAQAQGVMNMQINAPIPDPVNIINHSIFSTDATKPLNNIERNQQTNQEIIRLQQKDKPKEEMPVVDKKDKEPAVKEKTKFRDYFKGFTVEW